MPSFIVEQGVATKATEAEALDRVVDEAARGIRPRSSQGYGVKWVLVWATTAAEALYSANKYRAGLTMLDELGPLAQQAAQGALRKAA